MNGFALFYYCWTKKKKMQENKKGKKNTPPPFFFKVFKVLLIHADFPAAQLFTQSANPQFQLRVLN